MFGKQFFIRPPPASPPRLLPPFNICATLVTCAPGNIILYCKSLCVFQQKINSIVQPNWLHPVLPWYQFLSHGSTSVTSAAKPAGQLHLMQKLKHSPKQQKPMIYSQTANATTHLMMMACLRFTQTTTDRSYTRSTSQNLQKMYKSTSVCSVVVAPSSTKQLIYQSYCEQWYTMVIAD